MTASIPLRDASSLDSAFILYHREGRMSRKTDDNKLSTFLYIMTTKNVDNK
jgi:hypothetical protein